MKAFIKLIGLGLLFGLSALVMGAEGKTLAELMREREVKALLIRRAAQEARELARAEAQLEKWRLQEKKIQEQYTSKEMIDQKLREELQRESRARQQQLERSETGIGWFGYDE